MKTSWYLLLLTFLLAVLLLPSRVAWAQPVHVIHGDTMIVDWEDHSPSHLPVPNALRNAIYGDTAAGGARANLNRIYVLKLNGIYWQEDRIENSGYPLRLIGEPYSMSDPNNYPAIIQMTDTRSGGGGNSDTRMITGLHDVTLKNLYISGRTTGTGVQTSYQPIQIDASNHTFIFDNNIIEQSNFAVIAFTAKNNNIYYTNNKFRNLIGYPSTQQWEGRGISIWADEDTVIVENNTFFNLEFTPFQLEGGSAKYLRFNHNTIVNNGRNINTGNWFQSAYWTNNLIINAWWQGEGIADVTGSGRDPRNTHPGMFTNGALPSPYGPEGGRRIVMGKLYAWLDPRFVTLGADSIRRATFVDPVTKLDFLDIYTEHMNVGHAGTTDTVWLANLPAGMAYPCDDPDWLKPKYTTAAGTMIDSMWANITSLRRGITPAPGYFYKPTTYASDETWPLPENFTYTEASLLTAGTDGLPIGDLNWFPVKLADFNTNKATYVAQIEALAGAVVTYVVDSTMEAENGIVGGTATAKKAAGFLSYEFRSAGDILWSYNLAAALPNARLKIFTHMNGNTVRGENLYINGVNITNNTGYGEYHYTAPPLAQNAWDSLLVTKDSVQNNDAGGKATMQAAFDLPAGANTLEMKKSWGYQTFSGIDVMDNTGALVKHLDVADGLCTGGVQHVDGSKFAPSAFKYVEMGATGTITFNIVTSKAGDYVFRVFYQNYGSASSASFTVDGGTAIPLTLKTQADSTATDVISTTFPLAAGAHSIVLSGGVGANIDQVQVIRQVVGAVEPGELAQTFALSQNYPNPFNPTTTINFSLGKAAQVNLTVYNVLGQRVAQLVNDKLAAGAHTVLFNANNLATGVYFYRLEAGSFTDVKKMLLLK